MVRVNRKRNKNGFGSRQSNRTLNTVQRALALNPGRANTRANVDPYLCCVFKPFESMGHGSMRPDSASSKIITRDILQSYDIDTSSPLGIKISPMYPYSVSWWRTGSGAVSVNGNLIPVPFTAIPSGYTVPAGKADADFAGQGALRAMGDYEKARIQTIGWRLIYTGKPIDAQGYVLVDSSAFQVDVVDRQVPSTCFYHGFVAGTVVNYAADTSCAYANVETTIPHNGSQYIPLAPTQTSRLYRPEQGAQGILKRSAYSPNHTFKPVWNGGIAVLDHRNVNPNAVNSWISSPRSGDFAGNTILDDDFDSTMIHISAPGLWRLELLVCLEAVVVQNSTLEPLAKASPPLQERTLNTESVVMGTLPPAVPLNSPLVKDSAIQHLPSVEDTVNAVASLAMSRLASRPVAAQGPVIQANRPVVNNARNTVKPVAAPARGRAS